MTHYVEEAEGFVLEDALKVLLNIEGECHPQHIRFKVEQLILAFGEFAYQTARAEGVWFVTKGGESEKIATWCEEVYLKDALSNAEKEVAHLRRMLEK